MTAEEISKSAVALIIGTEATNEVPVTYDEAQAKVAEWIKQYAQQPTLEQVKAAAKKAHPHSPWYQKMFIEGATCKIK